MENFVYTLLDNIGIILVVVAVIYFIVLIINIIRAKNGKNAGFTFRMKNFIPFLIILIIGIYCLVTGRNINEFIN